VPGELYEDDVVLMVCLAGAGEYWRSGTTTRPSGGGVRTPACSRADVSGGGKGKWPVRRVSGSSCGADGGLDRGWEVLEEDADGEAERRCGLDGGGARRKMTGGDLSSGKRQKGLLTRY
jgi:hypothetical protein